MENKAVRRLVAYESYKEPSYNIGWQALFLIPINTKYHLCGGSIINKNWILTAAHCFPSKTDVSGIRVYVGLKQRPDEKSKYLGVEIIRKYPEFKENDPHHRDDIALVRLKEPIKFSQNVFPIKLGEILPTDQKIKGLISGWGKTEKGLLPNYLRQGEVEIYQDKDAKKKHKSLFGFEINTNRQVFASGNGIDTCYGDSGGPLACKKNGKWYLIGVTSYGSENCGVGGVYTRVSYYSEFVSLTINSEEAYQEELKQIIRKHH